MSDSNQTIQGDLKPPTGQRLSPNVIQHLPFQNPSSPPESIILLCPWMVANPRSISKYLVQLQSLYPRALVLILTSDKYHIFAPQSWPNFTKLFSPALDVILSFNPSSSSPSGASDIPINAIIFSNGGPRSLAKLAKLYLNKTGQPLPLQSLILDSGPGAGNHQSGYQGLYLSLPRSVLSNPISNFIGRWSMWLLMGLFILTEKSIGATNAIRQTRIDINDVGMFKVGGKRTYIYADEDLICMSAPIEVSAKEAEGKGWEVRLEKFEKSGHVKHALVDEGRYWEIVKRDF